MRFAIFLALVASLVRADASVPAAVAVRAEVPFDMPALKPFAYPDRTFSVADYGAKPDGSKCTEAFAKAMAACAAAGGGHVVVPAGTWTTGPVHFKSNCDLHLDDGATLAFTDDPADYLPAVHTTWEGVECLNYSPLIYAYGCENVAVTGKGLIAPKMDLWRKWFARPPAHMKATEHLYHWCSTNAPMAARNVPAIEGSNVRPHLIQMNRTKGVLLDGFRIRESPFWMIHLYHSENCIVRNLETYAHGHNNDGVDIEMTRNVLVENCTFDQGDDGIVLKAGRNRDAWRLARPTENVVVTNCHFSFSHTLVGIGSELSGGIRNVYVSNCGIANSLNLLYVKTNRRRGGFVENIYLEDIDTDSVKTAVFGLETDVLYQWAKFPDYELRYTRIRNVNVRNVHARRSDWVINVCADAHEPAVGLHFENVRVDSVRKGFSHIVNARDVTMKDVALADRTQPRTANPDEVRVGGELAVRLQRNFDRLEEKKYLPENVFLTMKESWDWPGDTEGRTILGLVMDAQATGRKPKHLDAILARLPEKLNEKGYMGPVFPGKLHEQQLSGNGWLLAGLCEHYRWTKDPKSLAAAKRLLENLFLPGRGTYATYPIDPAGRFKERGGASGNIVQEIGPWMLSTDIGCVFIAMDAMIRADEFLPSPELKACIEELLPRFLAVDQVAIRAQAHATLTALRGLLRYATLTGETRWRDAAERRFAAYCANCMTENFENYNWYERFDQPSESCAVVDSYMVAVELWRQTGKRDYLELAELIYWNALSRLQHRNGGFGLDACPGAGIKSNQLSVQCPEAHWCCTMRGAEGLASAAWSAAFVCGTDALLTCPRPGDYALDADGGKVRFRCSGDYPLGNAFEIEMLDDLPKGATLRVFRPHWTTFSAVRLNGKPAAVAETEGFVTVGGNLSRGDRLAFEAAFADWTLPPQVERNALGENRTRLFRGPFQFGRGADGELRRVYHLMDPSIWEKGTGAVQIVFP